MINTTAHLFWWLFKHNSGANLLEIRSYGSVTRESFPYSPKPIQLHQWHHHSAFPYSNEFLPHRSIPPLICMRETQRCTFCSPPRKPLTQANLPELIWGCCKIKKMRMIRLCTKYISNTESKTESWFSLKRLWEVRKTPLPHTSHPKYIQPKQQKYW